MRQAGGLQAFTPAHQREEHDTYYMGHSVPFLRTRAARRTAHCSEQLPARCLQGWAHPAPSTPTLLQHPMEGAHQRLHVNRIPGSGKGVDGYYVSPLQVSVGWQAAAACSLPHSLPARTPAWEASFLAATCHLAEPGRCAMHIQPSMMAAAGDGFSHACSCTHSIAACTSSGAA